jgi:hypothetical protein
MLESLVEWMSYPLYYAFDGATPPPRMGASHATIYPYGPFPAGDGKTVMLGLQNEREWGAFCERVLLQPDLAKDARFSSNSKRSAARVELRRVIVEAFSTLTAAEVVRPRRCPDRERAGERHARTSGSTATARATAGAMSIRSWDIPALLPPGSWDDEAPRMDGRRSASTRTRSRRVSAIRARRSRRYERKKAV